MVNPAAFISLLAFLVSLGALAFAARSVTRLADQYAGFAETHIRGLRSEIDRKEKEQMRMIRGLVSNLQEGSSSGARVDRELEHLKAQLVDLIARLDRTEQDMNTRLPSRRSSKSPVLRAFGT